MKDQGSISSKSSPVLQKYLPIRISWMNFRTWNSLENHKLQKESEEFKYDTKKYLSDLGHKHLRDVQENTNKLFKKWQEEPRI